MEKFSLANPTVKTSFERQNTALQILKTIDTNQIEGLGQEEGDLLFLCPLYVNTPMDRGPASANPRKLVNVETRNSILRKNIYYVSQSVTNVQDLIIQLTQTGIMSLSEKDQIVNIFYYNFTCKYPKTIQYSMDL